VEVGQAVRIRLLEGQVAAQVTAKENP